MSEVPRRLKLGPHRFTIDSEPATGRLLRDEDARGDSRPDQLLIRIDTDRPHSAVAETLLHEALHCAWHLTSLRSYHDSDAEEAVVAALSPLLLEMLQRNPKLVTYLLD